MSAYLLAGWIACAQIGGVLDWRPHVWITGRKGSANHAMNNLIFQCSAKTVYRFNHRQLRRESGNRYKAMQGLFFSMKLKALDNVSVTDCSASRSLRARHHLKGGYCQRNGRRAGVIFSYPFMLLLFVSLIASREQRPQPRCRHQIDSKRYGRRSAVSGTSQTFDNITQILQCLHWRCVEIADIIRQNALKVFSDAATNIFPRPSLVTR